jgi:hypothetical protein
MIGTLAADHVALDHSVMQLCSICLPAPNYVQPPFAEEW